MASNYGLNEMPISARVRTLSAKGQEVYQEITCQYDQVIAQLKDDIYSLIKAKDFGPKLHAAHNKYQAMVGKYVEYLFRTRTIDSRTHAEVVSREDRNFGAFFHQVISKYISSPTSKVMEKESHTDPSLQSDPKFNQSSLTLTDHSKLLVSHQSNPGQSHASKSSSVKSKLSRSRRSNCSGSTSASAAAMRHKAEVEAARVKVKFAEQEAQLLKERAEREAQRSKEEADREAQRSLADADIQTGEQYSRRGRTKDLKHVALTLSSL